MIGFILLFIFIALLPGAVICLFNGKVLVSALIAIPGVLAGIYYLVKQAVKDAINDIREKEGEKKDE